MMNNWYTNGHGMTGGGYAMMTIGIVVLLGLVIAGILALTRHTGNQQLATTPPSQGNPAKILAERLARGDIDNDEYQRRMDTLRGGARP